MSNFWDGFTDDDGFINTDHPVFRQRSNYYRSQSLIKELKEQREVNRSSVLDLLEEYCRLMNTVGQLKAEYESLYLKHKRLKEDLYKLSMWEKEP